MVELGTWQIIAISVCFLWSGFVRSGIGFGGAIFALPLMLLVIDNPLFFLPAIAVQAVFFTLVNTSIHFHNIDWAYLKKALKIIIIPKLIGVYGLIVFPGQIMSTIVFTIVIIYSLSYIFDRKIISTNKKVNIALLIIGGYVSGTSLIGAPLLAAVFANRVKREQLRDTLFALWSIVATIKLIALGSFGVDFHWAYQLWWFPLVAIGHFLGMFCYQKLQEINKVIFYRILGLILFLVSVIGIWQNWS